MFCLLFTLDLLFLVYCLVWFCVCWRSQHSGGVGAVQWRFFWFGYVCRWHFVCWSCSCLGDFIQVLFSISQNIFKEKKFILFMLRLGYCLGPREFSDMFGVAMWEGSYFGKLKVCTFYFFFIFILYFVSVLWIFRKF